MSNKTFSTIIAAVFTLAAAIPASAAPNSSDACSLLSQSQISAAVGKQVGAGTWMTPSFKATCNWTAPGVIVTLMTEGVDKYQAGKTPISPMMQIVAAGGIGDDAYYVVTTGFNRHALHQKGKRRVQDQRLQQAADRHAQEN